MRTYKWYFVILWMQVEWWGHSDVVVTLKTLPVVIKFVITFCTQAVGILDPWATWWNFHYLTFFPAVQIRSLGQGNVFTCVCHSVHRDGVSDVTSCLAAWSNVPSRGVLGHMFIRGGESAYRWVKQNPSPPPELGKWTVRIPLECILVLFCCSEIISCSLFLYT